MPTLCLAYIHTSHFLYDKSDNFIHSYCLQNKLWAPWCVLLGHALLDPCFSLQYVFCYFTVPNPSNHLSFNYSKWILITQMHHAFFTSWKCHIQFLSHETFTLSSLSKFPPTIQELCLLGESVWSLRTSVDPSPNTTWPLSEYLSCWMVIKYLPTRLLMCISPPDY